jgi:CRISPR system Cascade subunit CasA
MWQPRAVLLDQEGTVLRGDISFLPGAGCEDERINEPMAAYRVSKERGPRSVELNHRGAWREFDSLLPGNGDIPPRVVEHALTLARRNTDRFPRSVLIVGLNASKAKIEFWRMERFSLPGALAGTGECRSSIRQLLEDAESAQKSLLTSMRLLGRFLISRGDRKLQEDKWTNGKFGAGDVSKFVGCTKDPSKTPPLALGEYWANLERCFHEMLDRYSVECTPEDIRRDWLNSVRCELYDAWSNHAKAMSSGNSWTIRAIVRAEGPVRRKLRELDDQLGKLQPSMEGT